MAGFDATTSPGRRRWVAAVLVAAVLGISSSAVLVKLMDATALTIAVWRMLGAAVLVGASAGSRFRLLAPRHGLPVVLAGSALALHFWAWFASVQYTTVLRSTLLVSLVPLWTAVLEGLRGAGWPGLRQWLGLALALAGLAIIEGLDGGPRTGEHTHLGDALAILAGALWAIYLSIGRRVRQELPVAVYFGAVCLVGALGLGGVAAVTGEGPALLGLDASTAGLVTLAILGPQLLGHQGFAYAIRWVDATTISLLMLLEPVGATLLAWAVLGESPGAAAGLGGVVVVLGVGVATLTAGAPEPSGGNGTTSERQGS